MIQSFSGYVAGIAVFIIFAGFVSMIAPQKKYKEYIDLVMAFGLILVLITPISSAIGFLSGSSGFSNLTMTTAGVVPPNAAHIEQTQLSLILEQFSGELTAHLERIVDNNGQFSMASSRFYLDDNIDNFGAIRGVSVWIRERGEEQGETASRPFIRVERIEVTPFTRNTPIEETEAEDSRIISLKNAISNFYQIRNEHINIFVVD